MNQAKNKISTLDYEFSCPECHCDQLLFCYDVVMRMAFHKLEKSNTNEQIEYSIHNSREYDVQDRGEAGYYQCAHCGSTWDSLEDLIADRVLVVYDNTSKS